MMSKLYIQSPIHAHNAAAMIPPRRPETISSATGRCCMGSVFCPEKDSHIKYYSDWARNDKGCGFSEGCSTRDERIKTRF
ncbi:hypothetical protein A2U01_0020911 [Trifolium medium]|uniref:Uncharacterized protein n=1 Tax=Trifolium medium TaxID=97028 RepID=A0A392NJ24_9FABA|nr:hypothetical protein [Trifolium medium]